MKTINVVAAIINHNGYVFATQRGYGEFKDGWEFPGGKIEKDETGEQALVREIQEELATTIKPEYLLHTVEYDYPNFHLSMQCYISSLVSGKFELLEHENAKWLTKDNLYSVDWLPADLELIPLIEEIL